MDRLRMIVLGSAVVVTTMMGTDLVWPAWADLPIFAAQVTKDDAPALDPFDPYDRLARQGGPLAIAILVLWYYRRDFKATVSGEQARVNALLQVVQENIRTNQATTAALERLARAVEDGNRRSPDRGTHDTGRRHGATDGS